MAIGRIVKPLIPKVRGPPLKMLGARGQAALAHADPAQVQHLQEMCIAVNERDEPVQQVSKGDAHHQETMALHRAFSVFAFTRDGRLVLQKRSACKITFPQMWTNTCCSHPLWDEREVQGVEGAKHAAARKMEHELGVRPDPTDSYVFKGKYLYKANMASGPWGEHEMDYALILRNFDLQRIQMNPEEVEAVDAVSPDELPRLMNDPRYTFTPWFKLFVRLGHLQKWWGDLDNLKESKDQKAIFRMDI
ncbi:unnamed protein product, partial [Mesorhabditis spiculigera]